MSDITEATQEHNELIATWMGYKYFGWNQPGTMGEAGWKKNPRAMSKVGDGYLCRQKNGLRYRGDWNWLMKAIYKWDNLYPGMAYQFRDRYRELSDLLDNAVTANYNIKEAYDQLVKNIEWHNSISMLRG